MGEEGEDSSHRNFTWAKKSQAEKKIMAHLLFGGSSKEEENTNSARNRLRKRKKQKKPAEKKQEITSEAREFDIESVIRSIEGGSYKQPKKSNKRKKKKRKTKKSQPSKQTQSTQPPVKTEEQRQYRKIVADRGTKNLLYKVAEGLTVIGRTDRPGFRIPEKNIQFECSSIDGAEQHVFLSNINQQYGLSYVADNCEFISCPEIHCDRLVSVVQAWRDLQNGTPEEAISEPDKPTPFEAEDVEEKSPKEGAEEEEEVDAAGEMEEEEEDDIVWQSFLPGSSLEYPEVGGYVHAFESSDDCLAYCFSQEADPKRYSLVYINRINSSFFRKLHPLSKSDLIALPCCIQEDSTKGEMPFKSLEPFIQSNPDTTFLLFFPSLYDPSEAFSFFDDLIHNSSLDLSNTVLFLPYVEAPIEKTPKTSELQDLDHDKDDIQADGVEAEI